MPDDNDDKTNNNNAWKGIRVDNTKPISELYDLDPSKPDGENGWYVSDVEVTIIAYDPESNEVSSGVKEINYKIGEGDWQTEQGNYVRFIIKEEGKDILVQYYAIDNVGNEESYHTITIDMDQTVPVVDMTYEWSNSANPGSWWMWFNVTAIDATSGMDRVEYYLNDVIQETITGPGPDYSWKFLYSGGLDLIIKVIGFDMAGNFNSDEIINPTNHINIKQSKNKNLQQFIYKNLFR
jgi:hypothetical protein